VHNNVVKMYHPYEIKPEPPTGGPRNTPPNIVSAPHPVRAAQPISTAQSATPQFRSEVSTRRASIPGTGYNEVATPREPATRPAPRPIEYDRRPQQPEQGNQPQQEYQPSQPTQQPRSGGRR
jgi:hypothetical protein